MPDIVIHQIGKEKAQIVTSGSLGIDKKDDKEGNDHPVCFDTQANEYDPITILLIAFNASHAYAVILEIGIQVDRGAIMV